MITLYIPWCFNPTFQREIPVQPVRDTPTCHIVYVQTRKSTYKNSTWDDSPKCSSLARNETVVVVVVVDVLCACKHSDHLSISH